MEESLEVLAEVTELRDYLEAIWMTYPAEAMVPGG